MTTKLVKDLQRGDRVALEDGMATVSKVERCLSVEAAPKMGGAWTVDYFDDAGETGSAIVSGLSQVEICQ